MCCKIEADSEPQRFSFKMVIEDCYRGEKEGGVKHTWKTLLLITGLNYIEKNFFTPLSRPFSPSIPEMIQNLKHFQIKFLALVSHFYFFNITFTPLHAALLETTNN